MKHFLQLQDLKLSDITYILDRAKIIKKKFKKNISYKPLHGKILAMIFEKSSTRTRVSFESGICQLGGSAINLVAVDSQLGRSEPIEDTAQVISRMVDIVMIRTFEQNRIEQFANYSKVPVINGLTNEFHPCQVLSDLFTYIEYRGQIKDKIVAWIGDSNNMAYTWLQAAKIMGFTLHVSNPPGYELNPEKADLLSVAYKKFSNPYDACKNAHIISTDVWTSMGFESEGQKRNSEFKAWKVNKKMLEIASSDVIFMHCLPAHRGQEVTQEVIDGPQSVVWDEAENRLHVQKALMEFLILGKI